MEFQTSVHWSNRRKWGQSAGWNGGNWNDMVMGRRGGISSTKFLFDQLELGRHSRWICMRINARAGAPIQRHLLPGIAKTTMLVGNSSNELFRIINDNGRRLEKTLYTFCLTQRKKEMKKEKEREKKREKKKTSLLLLFLLFLLLFLPSKKKQQTLCSLSYI